MNTDGSKYRILASICATCGFPYLTGKDDAGARLPCPICERNAEIDRLKALAEKPRLTIATLRDLLTKYESTLQYGLDHYECPVTPEQVDAYVAETGANTEEPCYCHPCILRRRGEPTNGTCVRVRDADDDVSEPCDCGCPRSVHNGNGHCLGGGGYTGRSRCPCLNYTPRKA